MMVDELLIAHLMYAVTPFLWYQSILLVSLSHLPRDLFVLATSERCLGEFTMSLFLLRSVLGCPQGSVALELHGEVTALVSQRTGRTVLKSIKLSLILCT